MDSILFYYCSIIGTLNEKSSCFWRCCRRLLIISTRQRFNFYVYNIYLNSFILLHIIFLEILLWAFVLIGVFQVSGIEKLTMAEPIAQTMGDYCRPADTTQVSLGFIPSTPANFNIKYYVLSDLRDKQFDGNAISDPWEHLTRFYETTSMCQPLGIIEDQVKLKLFSFYLVGRAKY